MHKPIYDDKLIIITGALGFIGSCLVRHLNDKGFTNLLLVDDFDRSLKWKNLTGKKFVDIISSKELIPFLNTQNRDIESLVHLGANASTTETDGAFLYENNYRFTVNLCEKALENGIRFITASSAATYGDGSQGFKDDETLLDTLVPLNNYALSKHLFDLWAHRQNILKDIVSLKYFNVYGPNEGHKGSMSSMVYKMVPKVLKDGKIELFKSSEPKYPDGGQIRDFIYVKDAVGMTALFLENDLGGIYNIGSGQETTWNMLAHAVFKAMKRSSNIEYIPMPHILEKAYQNYTLADMHKFFKNTGYKLKFTLEQAVNDYVSHYLLKETSY